MTLAWHTDSIGIDRAATGNFLLTIVPVGGAWQEWSIYAVAGDDTARVTWGRETVSEDCREIAEAALRDLTMLHGARAA